jgi:enamine deaminase RidA (YjgF/YER057c/UK114 family)
VSKRVNVNPAGVWTSVGYPFDQAVVEPAGRRVHVTGQVAWDTEKKIVGEGDAERQRQAARENIAKNLAPLGGALDDIVSLTTLCLRAEDIPAINRARSAAFKKETGPASTSYQVTALVSPGLLVEIQAVATIPEARFVEPG